MALDIEKARAAGYSDAEIIDFLGKDSTLDIGKARKAGYKDSELIQYFTAPPAVASELPKPAAPVAPVVAPTQEKEMFPLLRQAADVPLKVGAGAVNIVRAVADSLGAEGDVSKNLRGVDDYIASLYSAQSKKDSKEISRIMKDAEDKGMLEQVVAGAKAFSVAPVDLLSSALGSAAPAIATALAATLAGAPTLVAAGLTAGLGALTGAGTIKGAIYDATKQALAENTDMSPKEIEARAILAQEYGGKNLDQILMGAAIGGIGARTGAEPALARQLAKGIATKEAVREAIKQNAARETSKAAERGVIKQGAVTGAKEFATESVQGGQEQLAQNIALQREGLDVPTMRGVYGQGTLEGLAGLGMGAAVGGREGAKARRELAEDATKGSDVSGDFTTAKEEVQRAGVGFSKENADLLMPASDAAGNPLVSGVAAPEITEATPTPKKTKAPKISAEGVVPESIQAANDYISKIDGGETIKQSDYRKVARSIGLSIPVGTKNSDAVELIRNNLAQQGAPSAATTGTDADAIGAGVDVAGEPATGASAVGAVPPIAGGVVSSTAVAQPATGGKGVQSAALTSAVQAPEPKDDFVIERKAGFRGGTSEKVEWVLRRKSDNQIIGYYPKKKDAEQTLDVYTLPKEKVFAKHPELRPPEALTPYEYKPAASGNAHLRFTVGGNRFELSNAGGKPQLITHDPKNPGVFYAEGKKFDNRSNVYGAEQIASMYPNLPPPVVTALQSWLSSSGNNQEQGQKVAAALNATSQQPAALIRGSVTPAAVRALSNEQLNTELANTNLSDAEYGLIKTELTQRQQGTTSGTATPQAQQAKAQGQAPATRPAAGSVSLGSLAPEIQENIQSRRDTVYEMVSEGASANKVANAYKALNALEESLGLDITKPTTLSAKRDKQGRLKTQDLIDEGGQATATEQDRTPRYQGDDLQEAMNLADKYDKQEEQEKQKAYEESLGKGESRYDQKNLPPNTEENYDAVAEELNAKAETANETRKGLASKVADLTQRHRDAVNEVERLEDAIDAAERNNDQKKLAALREQESEANSRESNLLGDLIDAQTALQGHGSVQNQLKPWYKLDSADKDIYFSYIRKNTPAEHRQAAAALLDAKNKAGVKSREGEGKMDAAERRAAQNYEDNRAQMSKLLGVQFPAWEKLSPAAKAVYLREVVNNAGQQQDVAFAKLGVKLIQDNKALSEQEKKRDQKNITDRQEEVRRKSEAQQESDRKTRENYERNKSSYSSLPSNVIQMIMSGNLRGVLDYMSNVKLDSKSAPTKRIMKVVAQALAAMNLDTKIVIVESSQIGGDLAQYDPVKDVIYVTREGMSSNTILHEIIHAATVKVINEYLYGNKGNLSQLQLSAVKQLERIMEETRGSLAKSYPEAYENLFEFVSYALTNDQLQQDLHDESATGADADRMAKSIYGEVGAEETVGKILPELKSQWSKFKLAIARIIKVRDEYLSKGKLDKTADTNYMMEISAAFEDILVKPTEPVYLPVLPAKKDAAPAKALKTAEEFRESGLYDKDDSYNLSERENPTTKRNAFYKMFTTREGWRNITRVVQDKSYASRSLFNKLNRAGLIKRDMSGTFNNFDEQGDLATGEARQFLTDYLQQPLDDVRQSFQEWIKLTGKKTDQALNEFHRIVEMFHEPERRLAKWVTSVPLSTVKNLTHNGKPISAAERRIAILGDQRTGAAGLIHKVDLTQQQKKALWQELTSLAENNADSLGDSPRISEKMRKRFEKPGSTHKGIDTDMDAPIYNVLGIEQATVDKRMTEYKAKSPEERAAIEKILTESKVLSDATAKLNQIGNYWSSPVSNLVGMYDYQYYMPFKGLSKHSKSDELIDPENHGKEMQEQEHSADGRFKTSDNPILQLINDAYRSAGRAGRRNYTQAIKNGLKPNKYNPDGTGVLPGEVVNTIKFEKRNITDMSKYRGGANIFHYNSDGSIDIIRINEPKILNALRYTFRDVSPMLDLANSITGFFGAMHTRYNYNFAPLNFVRDTLTNTWTIGASRQMGPVAAAQYLGSVGAQIVKNGLGKAMHVALLEEKGDAASKKLLLDAARDPFVKDMLEYLRFGGKTTYLQGFSLKSNLEQLSKNTIGRSRIVTNLEDAGRLIDSWNNMFEFTGRTAAYSIYKDRALAKNIKAGMSDKKGPQDQMSPAERAAAVEAAAFVKNLANFEKVGEKGRELGAAYMFIRPAATGAVRAIEAVMPAFTREKYEEADLPPQIADDPVAKAEYIKNFKTDRMYAQIMVGALTAGGMGLYFLSMLGAPDDEWNRNNTKTDNMEQWTRFARFHIPNDVSKSLGLGKDLVFQIPWGFGLGAFAATGAQFAGMASGNVSIKEGLGNIAGTILLDSFLPLPISKIPPTDSPLNWFVDSVAPSVFRPLIEFATNMNGIGQTINSASQRRMGDAFTGSDRIPEIYKDAAKWWFRATDGEGFMGVPGDVSPNTIYFLANSYLDGISKIGEVTYNWANLDKGEREFSPKNDIPLFGSFFGAKTNVDSRQYGKVEQKIKEIDKRLVSMAKDDPVQHALYVAKNPLYPSIVEAYQSKQGELNAIREKATEIRTMRYLSPKDRDQILKTITLEQNMLKYQMVQEFKVLGIEP